MKADGLSFYRPFLKQDAFHQAGLLFKRRMVRAGNRFGKSTLGCAEDCAWLRGERPWYAESAPARRGGIPQHAVKGLVITTDWDLVDDIWTSQRGENPGKIWRFLPKDGFVKSWRRNHSGAIDTIECANGSLMKFDTVKSFMANPQSSESADWDFIHVDEPCPEKMYKAAARGLMDRNGASWFTLTPLREWWINDMFFPEDTQGKPRDNVWAVQGSTYDNPNLPPEAIREFEAGLTAEERECRILGIPLNLSGLIYKAFSWDKHVLKSVPKGWESYGSPPKDYSIYVFIDPHPQTPHAALFCAVSPLGQRFYFRDLFVHCSIEEFAKLILEVCDGRHVVCVRVDPLAYINDPITESNMAEEFGRCGVWAEKATKALQHGILRVQGELAKEGTVYFSPACTRTLWEIQRYAWDEKDNKPVDKDDHMMENLYRCELEFPRYIDRGKPAQPVEDEDFSKAEFDFDKEPNYQEI